MKALNNLQSNASVLRKRPVRTPNSIAEMWQSFKSLNIKVRHYSLYLKSNQTVWVYYINWHPFVSEEFNIASCRGSCGGQLLVLRGWDDEEGKMDV